MEQQSDFWDSLWPQLVAGIVSSIIGIGGAYGLFLNGLRKDKEKERERENSELKDYFLYLLFSTNKIIKPTISQLESFTKLCNQLEIKRASDYHFIEVTSFNFKWFDELNKSKAQKAFFQNFPGINEDKYFYYNQLLKSVELLSYIAREYKPAFENFLENSNNYLNPYKEWLLFLMTMREDIIFKAPQDQSLPLLVSQQELEFLKASEKWLSIAEEERYDIYISFENWIIPLSEVAKNHRNQDLIKAIRHATNAFHNFKKITKEYILFLKTL